MFKSIVRTLAKWILKSYTGKLAGAALDVADAKLDASERLERICKWTTETAELLSVTTAALKDGNVSADERAAIVARFDAIGKELAGLISE